MAWTTPRTWSAGELVTANMMNSHVRDNENFLRGTAQLSQVTRGMRLRTHPDQDVATTKVLLVSCEELVTDLGTRVNPRANLVADITASGASGLDTGSRVASTWYEIYYIFKGPTATNPDAPAGPTADAIMLHRSKDYLQDQTQSVNGSTENLRAGAADRVKLAQSFKPGTTGLHEMIDVVWIKVGTPTGRAWLTLEADNSGAPSGTALATSDKVDVSQMSTTATRTRMVFRAPVSLTSATTYWLVFQGDYTVSTTNYAGVRYQNTDVYANGKLRKFDGTNWADDGTSDAAFITFSTENNAAATLPTGYTERCKIGIVYNNSGNALVLFIAQDRLVRTGFQTAVNAGSATTPTLVDLSTFIPPGPIGVIWGYLGTVAADGWYVNPVPDGMTATIAAATSFTNVIMHANLTATDVHNSTAEQHTEYQGVYYWRHQGSGTFSLYVWGYRW